MFLKKKAALLISIVLLTVILILSATAITYAVWTTIATANEELEVPVDEYNPSEKYIVWRGIDNSGAFSASPTAYAVVGYDGLVAELIIPPTHNSLPVTKICTDETNFSKRLNGNDIITSISIPSSVTSIASGACANMSRLQSVTIDGTSALTIGDLAFANCPVLTTFSTERNITGDSSSYLYGSPQN